MIVDIAPSETDIAIERLRREPLVRTIELDAAMRAAPTGLLPVIQGDGVVARVEVDDHPRLSDILQAITAATADGVDLVVLAVDGPVGTSSILSAAIEQAARAGTRVIGPLVDGERPDTLGPSTRDRGPAPREAREGTGHDYTRAAASGRWTRVDDAFVQSAMAPSDYLSGVRQLPDTFRVRADVQLPASGSGVSRAGGGLVVSMRAPGDLRHGYLVRFARGGREVFWGRYGADGLFHAESGVATTPVRGAWHRLELAVERGAMHIAIDGTVIARGVDIGTGDPWFGLLGFGGGVRFRDVEIRSDAGVDLFSSR